MVGHLLVWEVPQPPTEPFVQDGTVAAESDEWQHRESANDDRAKTHELRVHGGLVNTTPRTMGVLRLMLGR